MSGIALWLIGKSFPDMAISVTVLFFFVVSEAVRKQQ